jgi:hypothetical protein
MVWHMTKKKIAIVYDASYLGSGFPSVKEFILGRRFAVEDRPGLFKSLLSKIRGGRSGDEIKVSREGGDLFAVSEVVPKEVIRKLEGDPAIREAGHKAVATLIQNGAAQIEMAMDTIVSASDTGSPEDESGTAERILVYLSRLVSFRTNESFDLGVVASEDADLLGRIADMAQRGKAVIGVTNADITGTRRLHDKLSEVANYGASEKVTIEN